MKTTTIFLFTFLLTFSITHGQEEEPIYGFNKGDITLSGTISYFNGNSDNGFNSGNGQSFLSETETNDFSIIPEVGYFISDHFLIGARIGYLTGKSENTNDTARSENKTSGYSTGILGRYYLNPKRRFSFFTELEASYRDTDSEGETTDLGGLVSSSEGRQQSFSFTFAPGINIFLNKKLSLTSRIGRIGYSKSKNNSINSDNDTSTNESSGFGANISLDNFFFGVVYRI